jgi:hypothetical protein
MSNANNFSRIERDSMMLSNNNMRVLKGATELYTDPAYYNPPNHLFWQFASVPNPVPAQAPNHIQRLINTGVYPTRWDF